MFNTSVFVFAISAYRYTYIIQKHEIIICFSLYLLYFTGVVPRATSCRQIITSHDGCGLRDFPRSRRQWKRAKRNPEKEIDYHKMLLSGYHMLLTLWKLGFITFTFICIHYFTLTKNLQKCVRIVLSLYFFSCWILRFTLLYVV